jgi:uncharacterized phiE125 gp8 family phage protein
LGEAIDHLRITHTNDDEYVAALLTSARIWAENFQDRSYITQTWKLYLDRFPDTKEIELDRPPLVSVTSVKYTDKDDNESTFASSNYDTDTDSFVGRIVLKYDKTWPSDTLRPMNPIVIEYIAGYGDADTVPENVKHAIKIIVAHLYENRELLAPGAVVAKVPLSARALLMQDRIFTFA